MYMLHSLRDKLDLNVIVFEAGDGVGGTWYWNRYPGARCDSDSYVYCYTFDKNLLQEWDWSERYPEQDEILRYLEHCAERFDLSPTSSSAIPARRAPRCCRTCGCRSSSTSSGSPNASPTCEEPSLQRSRRSRRRKTRGAPMSPRS